MRFSYRNGKALPYAAALSLTVHILILGVVFSVMTNPFAGSMVRPAVSVIQVSLVDFVKSRISPPVKIKAETQQDRTMSAPGRKRMAEPTQEQAPAATPPPLPAHPGAPSQIDTAPQGGFDAIVVAKASGPLPLNGKTGSRAESASKATEATGAGHTGSAGTQGRGSSPVQPRYRSNPPPAYPRLARERGYEGVVTVTVEVRADGHAGKIKIKASSGYHLLDQAALNAVRDWTFEPAQKMGAPIATAVDIPVRFSLND